MRCERCCTPLEPDMRFCPECGCAVPSVDAAAENRLINDFDNREETDENEAFRQLAEQLDSMDARFDAPDSSDDPEIPASTSEPPRSFAPPVQETPVRQTPHRAAGIPDAYLQPAAAPETSDPEASQNPARQQPQRDADDFGDGYDAQPDVIEGKYRRVTAGKRIGSILLCILAAAMLLYTVLNVSLRLTLTEKNIRDAADSEKMVTQYLLTGKGSVSAVGFLHELIGEDVLGDYGITDGMLRDALRKGTFSRLAGTLLCGYKDYFLNDRVPDTLNAAYISGELERVNGDLGDVIGVTFDAVRVQNIADRINGGDLSFLSIDDEGGYFYRHYGFNPRIPATIGSLPILIICGVIALLCMVMIFVINSSNLPAALNFNGVVLLITGGFWLSAALGCLILSFIKDIWILTSLLRCMALWTGIISGALFLTGLAFVIVASALKKRAKRAETVDAAA